MADERVLRRSGLQSIRVESGKFFPAKGVGALVENFYPTREGTLRTVWGPIPYVPDYTTNPVAPPLTTDIKGVTGSIGVPPKYARIHGIHHAVIEGRDILLAHVGAAIWEYQGWNRSWKGIIGPSGYTPLLEVSLPGSSSSRDAPDWPTQFETLPNGIVIVPRRGRAYFYDGHVALPLGYATRPGAPQPHGPNTKDVEIGKQNVDAYAHDSRLGHESAMHEVFRFCRIGTTTSLGATGGATHAQPDAAGASNVGIAGWLEPGSFRCKRQWIDYFGNLSPLSEASDEIRFSRQIAVVNPTGVANRLGPVDVVRKQIAWSGLTAGRDGTLGQTLFRTTDLKNSGDAGYYELPQDAAGNAQAFATLPDNITTIYPDNIPDVWLGAAPLAPIAMPQFRLCRQAFSRLFMAQGGALYWSMVGRWGTILEDSIMYPDPSSAKITGLAKMAGGLVVFTERSTYLVTPNDSGEGFRSMVLNPQIGCAAPNSIQTMPDGVTIWLAREGFYVLVDGKVLPISADEDRTVRRFTPGRMQQAVSAIDQRTREYRCWVSMDGDTENTLCLCFRDGGWTRRTDVQASAVCTTQDHRAYMIAGGEVTKWDTDPTAFFRGVWVLDHESQYYQADNAAREAILETAWLNVGTSDIRKTTYKLFLWLIETSDAQLTIEVLRDWRNDVVETCTVERHTTEDVPMFFNEIAYDSTDANRVWRRRRPYYTKAEIFVPSAEVVKFRIRGTGFWEFIGLKWVDSPRMAGGHRIQR